MPVATEERGVTKTRAKVCPCEACKMGRSEPSKVQPLRINSYTSRPSDGWVKQATFGERQMGVPTLFMGVELETAVKGMDDNYEAMMALRRIVRAEAQRLAGPEPQMPVNVGRYTIEGDYTPAYLTYHTAHREWETIYYRHEEHLNAEGFGVPKPKRGEFVPVTATAEEAVSFAEPVGFWHAKHDGSVSGPEFASLPASLEYWYGIRSDLEVMFTGLLHAGVRSHTGDTAGMHVSMSVEAFADDAHLVRFAQLVNYNVPWSEKMSQRTAHSMSWGKLGHGVFEKGNEYSLYRWARSVMLSGEASQDRYEAINATCGGGRIEFRVPRGTLRIDRFYKNLEWVASMIEYTRDFAPTDAATYMRWVMDQTGRFADLKAWFTEKFRLIPTNEGFTPARAIPGGNPNTFGNRIATGLLSFENDGEDDDYPDFEPEEDPEDYECEHSDCNGMTHDLDVDAYQRFHWDWNGNTGNTPEHTYQDGTTIGPLRYFYRDAVTGGIFEHTYNSDGLPIDTDGNLVDEEHISTRGQMRYNSQGQVTFLAPVDPTPEEIDAAHEAAAQTLATWAQTLSRLSVSTSL